MSDLVTIVCMSSLFVLSIILTRFYRDLMNPLIIFITPLALQYWLYFFYLSGKSYTLNPDTNSLLFFSALSFVLGFLWIMIFPKFKKTISSEVIMTNSALKFGRLKKMFLFLGLTGFVLGLITAMRYGLSGDSSFFFNLRYSNTIEGKGLGISPYLLLFLHVLLLWGIVIRTTNEGLKKRKLIFIFLLLLIQPAFTMARTEVLITVVSALAAYLLTEKYVNKTKPKTFRILMAASLLFWFASWLIAIGTNKETMGGNNFIFSYLAYPIIAFDSWVLNSPLSTNGALIFAPMVKILNVFGLNVPVAADFGLSGGDFNVFTYMMEPYIDFGSIGLFVCCVSLGILYGALYRHTRTGKPLWIIAYSILLYPLVMSFFAYQYNLSSMMYYMLILFTVSLVPVYKRKAIQAKLQTQI